MADEADEADGAVAPRAIRVFVSSTFRDMQHEREELIKRVFPELRHRCEERGVTWGEVDLRWGVTDEEKAEGAVLPICLAEIQQSRPYFIALLGDRYGWVPDELAEELRAQEPWLEGSAGRSVTELEILHGVLNDPDARGRAYFYLRDPSFAATQSPDERSIYIDDSEEQRQKLDALKARIRASGFPVRDYADPIALGPLVLGDLGAMVDELFPPGAAPDPLARAAADQRTFASAVLAGDVVGRDDDLAAIDAAAGAGRPVLVTGEAGLGKSTLLAAWAARSSIPVVVHHVAASAEAADWMAMLTRWCGELSAVAGLGVDVDRLPTEPDPLKVAFADVLSRAGRQGPVALVLDGPDELDDRDFAPDLSWLPWTLPDGVTLVAAAAGARTGEAALARGFAEHVLPPLDGDARRAVAAGFLARYAKRLAPELLDRLAHHPCTGNPLYLRAVCDELRQHGDHFTLADTLDGYLEAHTTDDLFERILARWEHDYERERPGLVAQAMSLLWGARWGLSEAELLDLLGGDEPTPHAYWSPLRLAAGEALARRGDGLLAPAHDHLRTAIADRYLPTPGHRRAVHGRLATYFGARGGRRAVAEVPWQLRQAEDWDGLVAALSDPVLLSAAYRSDLAEVRSGWAALEGAGRRLLDAYQPVVDNPDAHADVVWEVARLLSDGGEPAAALRLHHVLVDRARGDGDDRRLAGALANLAAALLQGGELDAAERALLEQEDIARRLGDDALLQLGLGNRGVVAHARLDLDAALALMAQEEAICRRIGDRPGLQSSLGNQGAVLRDRRDFDGAMARFTEQERVAREVGDPTLINRALVNQAQVLGDRGETERALALLVRQEEECRRHGDLVNLAVNVGNRAAICLELGRLDEADALAAEELALARRLGSPPSLLRSLFVRANVAHRQGDAAAAVALLAEHEALARRLDDRHALAMGFGEQATLRREAGDLAGAIELHIEEERIYREAGDTSGVATSLGNQALVRHAGGDLPGALGLVNTQERILRPLGLPAMLQGCLGNKAVMLAAAGDIPGAIAALGEQLALARQLGVEAVVVQNLLAQAKVRSAMGDGAGLMAVLTDTETWARGTGARTVLALCLAQRATLALGTPGALNTLIEAEALARSTGSVDALQLALNGIGLIRLQQGDGAGAEAAWREQEQRCRSAGLADGLSAALGNLAIAASERGDLPGALGLLTEQEQLCRQQGDAQGLVLALANRGEVTARMPGRRADGLSVLEEAARTAESIGWAAMAGQIRQLASQL